MCFDNNLSLAVIANGSDELGIYEELFLFKYSDIRVLVLKRLNKIYFSYLYG